MSGGLGGYQWADHNAKQIQLDSNLSTSPLCTSTQLIPFQLLMHFLLVCSSSFIPFRNISLRRDRNRNRNEALKHGLTWFAVLSLGLEAVVDVAESTSGRKNEVSCVKWKSHQKNGTASGIDIIQRRSAACRLAT